MERVFGDFGFGRTWLRPHSPRALTGENRFPDIEVFQRNNNLVIRADLPGLSKDDVKVDVTEDVITIQAERKREHEEEKGGIYRSERSYGSFSRTITLPAGAISDQAKASFKDGVLEVTMPAPPESIKAGRRLEITESSSKK
jgi:HSP20 family protein